MEIKRRVFPPVYLVTGLLLMWVLHKNWPLMTLLPARLGIGGFGIIVLGIVITLWAAGSFHRKSTPLIPFKQPQALVENGLYRYTRNPMYLGMVLILGGMALHLGSLSPWFILPIFVLIIQYRFIHGEEAMLEDVFGAEYQSYKTRVRRWI